MENIRPLTINERFFNTPVSPSFKNSIVSDGSSIVKTIQPNPAMNLETNTTDNSWILQTCQFVSKNKVLFVCAAVIIAVIIYENKQDKKYRRKDEI